MVTKTEKYIGKIQTIIDVLDIERGNFHNLKNNMVVTMFGIYAVFISFFIGVLFKIFNNVPFSLLWIVGSFVLLNYLVMPQYTKSASLSELSVILLHISHSIELLIVYKQTMLDSPAYEKSELLEQILSDALKVQVLNPNVYNQNMKETVINAEKLLKSVQELVK